MMCRIDPEVRDEALSKTGCRVMDITEKRMRELCWSMKPEFVRKRIRLLDWALLRIQQKSKFAKKKAKAIKKR
jgi:hypothetical protein